MYILLRIDTNHQSLHGFQAVEDTAEDEVARLVGELVAEHLLDQETALNVASEVDGQSVLAESAARLADLLNDGWGDHGGEE